METSHNPARFAREKQALAILLSGSLLWTSGNLADAAQPGAERPVQYELAPPSSLGWVVDYYNASREQRVPSNESKRITTPLVILIQDLHAHYGVQKNIAGILEFLTRKLSSPEATQQSSSPAVTGRGSINNMMDPRQGHSGVTASGLPFALAVEGASGPIDSSVLAL